MTPTQTMHYVLREIPQNYHTSKHQKLDPKTNFVDLRGISRDHLDHRNAHETTPTRPKTHEDTALESHVAAEPTISAKVSAFTEQANSEMSSRGSGQVCTSMKQVAAVGRGVKSDQKVFFVKGLGLFFQCFEGDAYLIRICTM